MRRLASGQILQVVASGDRYDSPDYTDVPVVDATATYDAGTGRAAVFVANRSLEGTASLEADLRGIGGTALLAATTLHAGEGQDRHATNRDDHAAVAPRALKNAQVADGTLTAQLPPLSWTVFELEARRAS
jgi:alpha-N-arabinofuranosidase